MVGKTYKKGDIIFMDFGPSVGHEQKGERPALVVSSDVYNKNSGFVVVVPITSKIKNYPFEVPIHTLKTSGVVLSDQVKLMDFVNRRNKKIDVCDKDTLFKVVKNIRKIVDEVC